MAPAHLYGGVAALGQLDRLKCGSTYARAYDGLPEGLYRLPLDIGALGGRTTPGCGYAPDSHMSRNRMVQT